MIMRENDKFTLYNKNVIVTGVSGGLGRALSERLINKYACRVLGVGRREEPLREMRAELGESFSYYVGDVSRQDTWKKLAAYVAEGKFAADVLLNNAGMLPAFSLFGSCDRDETRSTLDVNLHSVMWAAEEFLPLLLERKSGAFITVASADALCPLAGTSVYSATKAGAAAFSACLREEYRGRIYIPEVCPGFIRTDIMRHQQREVSPLVVRFSMPTERAARILLRRVNARRSRIVIGFDAHCMDFGYRLAPVLTQRACRFLMTHSGMPLFSDI